MQGLRALTALLLVGCGATPRGLPEGMKGVCEPPGGTVAVSVGPASSHGGLRVDVTDVDGEDRNAIAEGTIVGFVADAASSDADDTKHPVPGGRWVAVTVPDDDPWRALTDRGWRALDNEAAPVRFGRKLELASSTTAAGYALQVSCQGNMMTALIPAQPSRMVEARVTIDCTGGWGLPIVTDDYYFPDRHLITR